MYIAQPGARIFYHATGNGHRDLFLCPQLQPVTYSRQWKNQIPYLSRSFRTVTMDHRGSGRSDRPPSGYDLDTRYGDLVAVLDEAVRPPFAMVATSCATLIAFRYVAEHPDRVSRLIVLGGQFAESVPAPFEEKVASVIRNNFDSWRTRLFTRIFPEPHSLKGIEDGIAWAGETAPEILIESLRRLDGQSVFDLLGRVRVPTLAIHGTLDKLVPYAHAQKLVEALPDARLVTFEGGGHSLHARDPVKVNRLIRDFAMGRSVESHSIPPITARRAPVLESGPDAVSRPSRRPSQRRILWLSSPIGLGHIQRDIAIARRLREINPDATIDFLAADPARRVVEHAGERLHPATDLLLNETAHVEGWSADHELHVFNALWGMDDIMAANFMTFADAVDAQAYDLWVGDEGWDLDYFLHENPELKRAPYAFITDFIGMLPMREDPTSTEFVRCWEKNAQNVDHLREHPDVRDLSLMVGDEDDVLDRAFGPDLPNMRQWAREHFRFSGYTHHFDPAAYRDKAALRRELGFREGERIIVVSVGGTRVGRPLLAKCAQAFSLIASRVPEARMILVGGPRLTDLDLPRGPQIETRPFVPNLFRHHAAADLAIVQGGLTTTMELAALRTPFLYFPLRHHFEQQYFVSRRLERLGAGVRMDFDRITPEALGATILDHLGKPAPWAETPAGGTERAARMLAEFLP